MKTCIIGGTGNISLPIVKLLLERGHEVTCFNRGQLPGLPNGAKQITGDRKDRAAFEAAMQGEKFDAVIDMICYDGDDAASDVRAFAGVKHFVQVSTVCTYGVDYDWLPVTEDHPMRPISDYGRNKVAADHVFMEAHHRDGFPVTIVKPSTTFGPKMGLLRQVAWDHSWLHRIETGRPMLILGEGHAPHQFLHVNDAAIAFAHLLGRDRCIGQTYNLVKRGFTTWKQWHEAAMHVIGNEVELVGTTLAQLEAAQTPGIDVCKSIFAHNCYYSGEKILRDVPEFQPKLSLEAGIRDVYLAMKQAGRIPESEVDGWEDRMIGG